jgi:hypothetical protein
LGVHDAAALILVRGAARILGFYELAGFRMLLTSIVSERLATRRSVQRRRALLGEILGDFGRAFPDLIFEVDDRSSTVNAQAIMQGARRVVRIYGGLAYHPHIGGDGLVFALLHETGHHLASGGRLASGDGLGCECAADRWALTKGWGRLTRQTGRTFVLDRAISSLEMLSGLNSSIAESVPARSKSHPRICWATDWSRRKRVLTQSNAMPAIPQCYLSEFFTSETNYI